MLHAASLDGVALSRRALSDSGMSDIATSMAIRQGCKRVSSEAYVQQQCEALMSGKPVDEVAVGIAAAAGYAGCMAMGAGPILATACSAAATAIANWLMAEYTPAERAEMLYDAARGGPSKLSGLVYLMGGSRAFAGWPTCIDLPCVRATLPGIIADNLTLIGAGGTWTRPRDQGIAVILMAMAASGRGAESVYWWVRPRRIADIPSPPRPTVMTPSYDAFPGAYPDGSIAAYDPAIAAYRIAAPVGLAGAAYREVGTSAGPPAGVTVVPLSTYQDETGTKPWYRTWKVLGVVAVAAAAAGGGALMLRRKRRR